MSAPVMYGYRVMYRHYDGSVCVWSGGLNGGLTEDSAREDLAEMLATEDRIALLPIHAPRREWWIERQPLGAWERVES